MTSDLFSRFGPNAGYLTELYKLYSTDPTLVEPSWSEFFSSMNGSTSLNLSIEPSTNGNHNRIDSATSDEVAVAAAASVQIPDAFRRLGHLTAKVNPLEKATTVSYLSTTQPKELNPSNYLGNLDPTRIILNRTTNESAAGLALRFERIYGGSIGFEVMHIVETEEREWLLAKIESRAADYQFNQEQKKRIFEKLVKGDLFESELHRKYVGTKRFSVEGCETVIPILDTILATTASLGTKEIVIGMAHRGRLNVLANTLDKPLEEVFAEFQDQSIATVVGAGDVKYHLGFSGEVKTSHENLLKVQMAPNPSHLEFVNPVVEGIARALQDSEYNRDRKKVLPIILHGDAAVAGQGVVFETVGYSLLKGYTTGGTLHIVVNNQIGFTTTPDESRSSQYCTDFAKGLGFPIFHVNAEDPEAACWVGKLATEYRDRFQKDVFIDLIGYRKHGHNEGDDPSFTQPLTYSEIKSKQPVWMKYGSALIESNTFTQEYKDGVVAEYKAQFANAESRVKAPTQGEACAIHGRLRIPAPETGVSAEILKRVARQLTAYPSGFLPHPKLAKIIEKRVDTVVSESTVEWGVGEALAFGSLVIEGKKVRLSGQDCGRGTFSQRHIILDHYEAPATWSPLEALGDSADSQKPLGHFEVHNSSLSETGVLAFEFGYAATKLIDLVIWEAQFGDFSNGAQVIIDQFIASSEAKWNQLSGITLMLPHGYEGQGPEHSSARLERFLQLCGEGNMCVCYPSTSAQHFHLLRRQAHLSIERPLIIMTPKSLLRLQSASSPFSDFTNGSFKPIIEEDINKGGEIKTVVLTSGKVYHDLMAALNLHADLSVRIVRIEQLHPFPQFEFKKALKEVSPTNVIWLQEEPENMGAWSYIQPYLVGKLELNPEYIGRPASASTATGSAKRHAYEQKQILNAVIERIRNG